MLTGDVVNFVNSYYRKEFVWGVSDCCTFIKDFLSVSKGRECAKSIKVNWKTKLGAARQVKKQGIGFSKFFQNSEYCEKIDSVHQMRTGDIVVINQKGDWETSGIMVNGMVALMVEGCGLKYQPIQFQDIKMIVRVI